MWLSGFRSPFNFVAYWVILGQSYFLTNLPHKVVVKIRLVGQYHVLLQATWKKTNIKMYLNFKKDEFSIANELFGWVHS